jgi:hypothetical protein
VSSVACWHLTGCTPAVVVYVRDESVQTPTGAAGDLPPRAGPGRTGTGGGKRGTARRVRATRREASRSQRLLPTPQASGVGWNGRGMICESDGT